MIKADTLLFFDCDGVILNSNEIKSSAFFEVAKNFAPLEIAEAFLQYHVSHGGITRYKKFEYLFSQLLRKTNYDLELHEALSSYEKIVFQQLLECDLIDGVEDYLKAVPNTKYVVSGGKETELHEVFERRNLKKYFAGIHGGPRNKYQIIEDINPLSANRIFFGDSKVDYEVATAFKMDFVFISSKTEFKDWQTYFADKSITKYRDFKEALQKP